MLLSIIIYLPCIFKPANRHTQRKAKTAENCQIWLFKKLKDDDSMWSNESFFKGPRWCLKSSWRYSSCCIAEACTPDKDLCRCFMSLILEVRNVEARKMYCECMTYESWCLWLFPMTFSLNNHRIIESQNYRMFWVKKDLKSHLVTTPLLWTGTELHPAPDI